PLSNVDVMLIVGSHTQVTTTDGTGVFTFNNVPATGNVVLLYEAGGYLSARGAATFSESEGGSTYENPTATAAPIWMVQTGHTLSVRLIDKMGRPLPQVELTLRMAPSWFVLNGTWIDGVGEFHTNANTNNLGLAEFRNLPIPGQLGDSSFNTAQIYIPDVDVDGDGYADYTSTTKYIDIRYNSGTIETITLNDEIANNLTVSGSTNPYFFTTYTQYPGAFDPGETIYVSFNRPPSEEDLTVTLYENKETNPLSWPILPSLNGNLLEFDLPDDVTPGEKYFIHVYAHTADNGSIYEKSVPVFIKADAELAIVGITKNDPLVAGSPITIVFNQYVGTGDPFTTYLTGTNGVIFMNWDYDATGATGDYPGEHGYYTTNIPFAIDEITPAWVPGYSNGSLGFSKKWVMSNYNAPTAPSVGTIVNLDFDKTVDQSYRIKSPDGNLAPNLTANLP
ncbi:carboxypeptidase-like regulatory domain-containing protein, partial [Myxococcota bacterium]|nr:carboxypeptidase-like regulatory domain-containing protein [Myxococcota bacterium]